VRGRRSGHRGGARLGRRDGHHHLHPGAAEHLDHHRRPHHHHRPHHGDHHRPHHGHHGDHRRGQGPAAPGTYRYDTTGRSTFAGTVVAFPSVTSLVVDPPSGTRQRLARDLRDASGNGLATEFTLDYRPEGVLLVSLRLSAGFGGISDTRELRPASPVLLLATGARPGAHVEADLTGTPPARLVVDVVGEERVTVAGTPVDTVVVRATVTLAPGDVTGRQELTLNLDRGSRLWVRERAVLDVTAAGGLFTLHSEYSATLQRLNS
jgi:hypothetical protein